MAQYAARSLPPWTLVPIIMALLGVPIMLFVIHALHWPRSTLSRFLKARVRAFLPKLLQLAGDTARIHLKLTYPAVIIVVFLIGYLLGSFRSKLKRKSGLQRSQAGPPGLAVSTWAPTAGHQLMLSDARLTAALDLLRDLLPGHVVDQLLHDAQLSQQHQLSLQQQLTQHGNLHDALQQHIVLQGEPTHALSSLQLQPQSEDTPTKYQSTPRHLETSVHENPASESFRRLSHGPPCSTPFASASHSLPPFSELSAFPSCFPGRPAASSIITSPHFNFGNYTSSTLFTSENAVPPLSPFRPPASYRNTSYDTTCNHHQRRRSFSADFSTLAPVWHHDNAPTPDPAAAAVPPPCRRSFSLPGDSSRGGGDALGVRHVTGEAGTGRGGTACGTGCRYGSNSVRNEGGTYDCPHHDMSVLDGDVNYPSFLSSSDSCDTGGEEASKCSPTAHESETVITDVCCVERGADCTLSNTADGITVDGDGGGCGPVSKFSDVDDGSRRSNSTTVHPELLSCSFTDISMIQILATADMGEDSGSGASPSGSAKHDAQDGLSNIVSYTNGSHLLSSALCFKSAAAICGEKCMTAGSKRATPGAPTTGPSHPMHIPTVHDSADSPDRAQPCCARSSVEALSLTKVEAPAAVSAHDVVVTRALNSTGGPKEGLAVEDSEAAVGRAGGEVDTVAGSVHGESRAGAGGWAEDGLMGVDAAVSSVAAGDGGLLGALSVSPVASIPVLITPGQSKSQRAFGAQQCSRRNASDGGQEGAKSANDSEGWEYDPVLTHWSTSPDSGREASHLWLEDYEDDAERRAAATPLSGYDLGGEWAPHMGSRTARHRRRRTEGPTRRRRGRASGSSHLPTSEAESAGVTEPPADEDARFGGSKALDCGAESPAYLRRSCDMRPSHGGGGDHPPPPRRVPFLEARVTVSGWATGQVEGSESAEAGGVASADTVSGGGASEDLTLRSWQVQAAALAAGSLTSGDHGLSSPFQTSSLCPLVSLLLPPVSLMERPAGGVEVAGAHAWAHHEQSAAAQEPCGTSLTDHHRCVDVAGLVAAAAAAARLLPDAHVDADLSEVGDGGGGGRRSGGGRGGGDSGGGGGGMRGSAGGGGYGVQGVGASCSEMPTLSGMLNAMAPYPSGLVVPVTTTATGSAGATAAVEKTALVTTGGVLSSSTTRSCYSCCSSEEVPAVGFCSFGDGEELSLDDIHAAGGAASADRMATFGEGGDDENFSYSPAAGAGSTQKELTQGLPGALAKTQGESAHSGHWLAPPAGGDGDVLLKDAGTSSSTSAAAARELGDGPSLLSRGSLGSTELSGAAAERRKSLFRLRRVTTSFAELFTLNGPGGGDGGDRGGGDAVPPEGDGEVSAKGSRMSSAVGAATAPMSPASSATRKPAARQGSGAAAFFRAVASSAANGVMGSFLYGMSYGSSSSPPPPPPSRRCSARRTTGVDDSDADGDGEDNGGGMWYFGGSEDAAASRQRALSQAAPGPLCLGMPVGGTRSGGGGSDGGWDSVENLVGGGGVGGSWRPPCPVSNRSSAATLPAVPLSYSASFAVQGCASAPPHHTSPSFWPSRSHSPQPPTTRVAHSPGLLATMSSPTQLPLETVGAGVAAPLWGFAHEASESSAASCSESCVLQYDSTTVRRGPLSASHSQRGGLGGRGGEGEGDVPAAAVAGSHAAGVRHRRLHRASTGYLGNPTARAWSCAGSSSGTGAGGLDSTPAADPARAASIAPDMPLAPITTSMTSTCATYSGYTTGSTGSTICTQGSGSGSGSGAALNMGGGGSGGGSWHGFTGTGGSAYYGLGRHLPYAEWHPCVSVMFADIVGFTQISNGVPAVAVMEMLNALYCRLDALCSSWHQQHLALQQQQLLHPCHHPPGGGHATYGSLPPVYKVQIIGDAYMVATGLLADDPGHAATACMFGLAALREAAQVLDPGDGQPLRLRVGIHSGPVVSGVVGRMRRQYSVFGDTVNVASRMESTGAPGAVHVSEETQRLAAPHMPPYVQHEWCRREGVEVKGKGKMNTYWLRERCGEVGGGRCSVEGCGEAGANMSGCGSGGASEAAEGAEGCVGKSEPCANCADEQAGCGEARDGEQG